ncbi:MAG: hypothetical protein ACI4LY_07150, partial [Candidatus Fimisoma sp.]
ADKARHWLTQTPAHLPSPLKIRRFEVVSLREMIVVSLRLRAVNVPKDRQRPCRVLQNLYRLQTWHRLPQKPHTPSESAMRF